MITLENWKLQVGRWQKFEVIKKTLDVVRDNLPLPVHEEQEMRLRVLQMYMYTA